MKVVINRMRQRLSLFIDKKDIYKRMILEPGVPLEIDDETENNLKTAPYTKYYLDKGKIEIANYDVKPGISEDADISKTSEKKKPEGLKVKKGKEEAGLGRKTAHKVENSFLEDSLENKGKKD